MRPFRKLNFKKKTKRIFYAVLNWVERYVVGGYKRGGIVGVYEWVRCHTINRYHILDLSQHGSSSEKYRWGWIDRDDAMFIVCFLLLTDYVEKEDPEVGFRTRMDYAHRSDPEWQHIDRQLDRDREVRALYNWWKVGRKEECDAAFAALERNDNTLYDKLEDRDEEMLMRLMKIRPYLWT